jgi:hypothetical protein
MWTLKGMRPANTMIDVSGQSGINYFAALESFQFDCLRFKLRSVVSHP